MEVKESKSGVVEIRLNKSERSGKESTFLERILIFVGIVPAPLVVILVSIVLAPRGDFGNFFYHWSF